MLKKLFQFNSKTPKLTHNTIVDITLFSGVSLAVVLIIISSINLMRITGPTSLAETKNGDIVIALYDRFILMTKTGNSIKQTMFSEVGINGLVNDIQPLENGRLIIGDGGSRSLYDCDAALNDCALLSPQIGATKYDVGKYHKFYIDENNQHIILSNTENHALVLLNFDGSLKSSLFSKSGELWFPDGMAYADNNQILLANGLKQEILRININHDKAKILNHYPIENAHSIGGQTLPTTMIRTQNNQWWVAAQSNDISGIGASLLRFDDELIPIDRIKDEALIHPMDMLDSSDFVLVADLHAFKIHAINYDGRYSNEFGDKFLNNVLSNQKQLKALNGYLRWFSIAALVILLGIALYFDKIRKKEKLSQISITKEVDGRSNINFNLSETLPKMLRVIPIAILLLYVSSSYLLYGANQDYVLSSSFQLFYIILIAIMAYLMAIHIPKSITINEGIINITNQNNKIFTCSIGDVTYTNNTVFIKNDYYHLGNNGILLKDKEGYNRMMELFSNAKKVSSWQSQKYILNADRKYLLSALVIIILMIATFFLSPNDENTQKDRAVIIKSLTL